MIIGTSVKITTELSLEPDSVPKIDVYDPNDVKKVDAQDMSNDNNLFYSYVFQSEDSDTPGQYKSIITVVKSGKTAKSKHFFKLNDQDEEVGG